MLELFLKSPNDVELRRAEALPELKDDEVKIKLTYGGICGSDLRVFQGKLGYAAYPLRVGHEIVGTIIEAGKDAKYAVGTRVVVIPNTYCGQCEMCRQGKTNICPDKKSLGVTIDGGFAEQFIISSKYVLRIPDDLPDEKAILIEPFAVVVHAFNKVHITKDTTVAIVGCGNEGMLAALLALHLGANVTAMDINPVKLDLIRSFGDIAVVHSEDVGNETFDVVIEAAGTRESVEQGLHLVKPGGSIVLIGITPEASLPVIRVVRNEITLFGTIIYSVPDDFIKTIEYLRNEQFDVSPIVSKVVPLTQYKHAFETALSGNHGKIILDFRESL